MWKVVLFVLAFACISYSQHPALPCESYCNIKRQNLVAVENDPPLGRCLYNANPLTRYGRSCYCEDGYSGTHCLEKNEQPSVPAEPHVNWNCAFYTAHNTTADSIRLCGCSIGWGGENCTQNCTQMINCTEPNTCYYAEGQFKCACAKNIIGSNCEYDMTTLFKAHDISAGYFFLVGYGILFLFSLLLFGVNIRHKGCNFKLFCIMLVMTSSLIKFVMSIYNIIGVQWRYTGNSSGLLIAIFEMGSFYTSSLGSVVQLCCNVAMIFLCKLSYL